jgi:hypothetical protein
MELGGLIKAASSGLSTMSVEQSWIVVLSVLYRRSELPQSKRRSDHQRREFWKGRWVVMEHEKKPV